MARLLNIHAHPDDEASKGAPSVAKYVEQGHEAFLVCATGGEQGDIINPVMDRPEIVENLAAVRIAELERSVAAIGYGHLDWLGYEDSGMADSAANNNPACFAQCDVDEAIGRFVKLIRLHKPHVITTYSDIQPYKHPDHLMVHNISGPAVERAADKNWYPEFGEPWQTQKLYYSLWSHERMTAHHETYARLNLESPFTDEWFERESQDHRITTLVPISGYYQYRRAALLAHATQIDPDDKFWFGLPDDQAEAAYPYDEYILAWSAQTPELPEDCLFTGVAE